MVAGVLLLDTPTSLRDCDGDQLIDNITLRIHAKAHIRDKIDLPSADRMNYVCGESEEVAAKVESFSLKTKCSSDLLLWPSTSGKLLPCHFLTEHNTLPSGFRGSHRSIAHYVSLLPSRNEGPLDVVFTNQQVLQVMCATNTEQAVLLANFFLSLDRSSEVYLVCGIASFPDNRREVFVLSKRGSSETLWNPKTGRIVSDSPLTRIHYLANRTNVFAANPDRFRQSQAPSFDLTDRRRWTALFPTRQQTHSLLTIQSPVLSFAEPDAELARTLESDLDDYLRDELRKMRKNITVFRPDVSRILATRIEQIEAAKRSGVVGADDKNSPTNVFERSVVGLTLNFPYTSHSDSLKRLAAARLHLFEERGLEFALSTRVFSYPGGVLSVWLSLAVLKEQSGTY